MKPTLAQRRVLEHLRDFPVDVIEQMVRWGKPQRPFWSKYMSSPPKLTEPTFDALLNRGWIERVSADRQWRFYRLSPAGHAVLQEEREP